MPYSQFKTETILGFEKLRQSKTEELKEFENLLLNKRQEIGDKTAQWYFLNYVNDNSFRNSQKINAIANEIHDLILSYEQMEKENNQEIERLNSEIERINNLIRQHEMR